MSAVAEAQPESISNGRPKATLKKRLVASLGDKGGTSKSFVVRKLAEMHLEAKTHGLLLIDGDQTVGSLYRFYHEAGVEMFGLHGKLDARDKLTNDLLYRGADFVIVDLPATSLTKLRDICEEYDFTQAAADAGYRLTIIAPITPYDDTVLDLQEAIALIDPQAFATFTRLFDGAASEAEVARARAELKTRADYVAIINLGMAEDRDDFAIWDAGDSFTRKLFAFVGGVELEFPRLRPRIAAKLAKDRLWFKAGESAASIAITDRSRLQKWNESAGATLRAAGELLGF